MADSIKSIQELTSLGVRFVAVKQNIDTDESCRHQETFIRCNFTRCIFGGTLYRHVRFESCTFNRCDFGMAQLMASKRTRG